MDADMESLRDRKNAGSTLASPFARASVLSSGPIADADQDSRGVDGLLRAIDAPPSA